MFALALLAVAACVTAQDPAQGWMAYAVGTVPKGTTRITRMDMTWTVGANAAASSAFYSPWFGMVRARPPPLPRRRHTLRFLCMWTCVRVGGSGRVWEWIRGRQNFPVVGSCPVSPPAAPFSCLFPPLCTCACSCVIFSVSVRLCLGEGCGGSGSQHCPVVCAWPRRRLPCRSPRPVASPSCERISFLFEVLLSRGPTAAHWRGAPSFLWGLVSVWLLWLGACPLAFSRPRFHLVEMDCESRGTT